MADTPTVKRMPPKKLQPSKLLPPLASGLTVVGAPVGVAVEAVVGFADVLVVDGVVEAVVEFCLVVVDDVAAVVVVDEAVVVEAVVVVLFLSSSAAILMSPSVHCSTVVKVPFKEAPSTREARVETSVSFSTQRPALLLKTANKQC